MKEIAEQLTGLADRLHPRLRSITEEDAVRKPYLEKWSRKEILGHLIDSASNNHQRIVRMQESPDIGTFRYAQDQWVNVQQYQAESWVDLVELWFGYNRHLAHVIRHMHPASLDHVCDVGYPQSVTLRYLVHDYLDHLDHHLRQIFSDDDPKTRKARTKREF